MALQLFQRIRVRVLAPTLQSSVNSYSWAHTCRYTHTYTWLKIIRINLIKGIRRAERGGYVFSSQDCFSNTLIKESDPKELLPETAVSEEKSKCQWCFSATSVSLVESSWENCLRLSLYMKVQSIQKKTEANRSGFETKFWWAFKYAILSNWHLLLFMLWLVRWERQYYFIVYLFDVSSVKLRAKFLISSS